MGSPHESVPCPLHRGAPHLSRAARRGSRSRRASPRQACSHVYLPLLWPRLQAVLLPLSTPACRPPAGWCAERGEEAVLHLSLRGW